MEARLNWRIKQFGTIIASGFGPEDRAMAEATNGEVAFTMVERGRTDDMRTILEKALKGSA